MRLMIVDDDRQIREGIRHGIDWHGQGVEDVRDYKDGAEAIAAFEEFKPDIIVADIRMPRMDGLELLKHVRELDTEIRFILLSAYSDFKYCKEAISLGANDYELKPIKAATLLCVVKENITRLIESRKHQKDADNTQQTEEQNQYSAIVMQATAYIQEHYKEQITIEQVASFVDRTPNYLSTILKKEIGVSFTSYLTGLRMDEAKRLITTTGMSIYEIAEQVGYNDYAYFSKLFRKLYGKPATSIRKHLS